MQRRVDVLIAGTQKGGTTALDSYLREHPDLCMARDKEVHFFDRQQGYTTDGGSYRTYHANFSPSSGNQRLAEATPIYMYWHAAPARIHAYNPAMKFILLLRNPIDRAYSHWNMERMRGWEPLSFLEAIDQETERCREALPYQHRIYSYVDRGFYLHQLERIWRYFPCRNTLILPSEALRHQPAATLETICRFLAIPPPAAVSPRLIHCRPYPEPMQARAHERLRSLYADEIGALARCLDWDCRHWLADPA